MICPNDNHDDNAPLLGMAWLRNEPTVLHHPGKDGKIERVTVDFDRDAQDDLTISTETCTGVLDFGGTVGPGLHPVNEGHDAGDAGELPVNVTTYAVLSDCGTKAQLSVWPRAVSRAGAIVGLFRQWPRERAIRVLIRQAHALFVLNKANRA